MNITKYNCLRFDDKLNRLFTWYDDIAFYFTGLFHRIPPVVLILIHVTIKISHCIMQAST